LPASFTFAVTVPATNGSAIRDLTVDWGGGTPRTQDLGAVDVVLGDGRVRTPDLGGKDTTTQMGDAVVNAV
jgi:isocitrate/isopropylmalate dehydrogenase